MRGEEQRRADEHARGREEFKARKYREKHRHVINFKSQVQSSLISTCLTLLGVGVTFEAGQE
jgi:hypothetical protein